MVERGKQTKAAVDELATVQQGPPSEHVTAAAVIGMVYRRLTEQLLAIPPPAHLAADPMLSRHYRKGLDDVAAEWQKAAQGAFFHCAKHAALQTDAAFGLWLELCHEHLAELTVEQKQAEQRAARLAAESAAARLQAAGVPPPGPEVCWKPHAARLATVAAAAAPSPAAAAASTPAAVAASTPAAVASTPSGPAESAPSQDAVRAGPECALSSPDQAALESPKPASARDALYGARDSKTGVRVSVATEPLPSMDLRPLAAASTHAALAACFARHVKQDEAVTVAAHGSLSVDARGHVKSAAVAAEPSDQARAPGRPLQRCLERVLKKVRFDCSPNGQPTQGKALICLRRD